MAKINKLTAGIIKNTYSKEFTQKKIILNIADKDYEVLIDEKFKTSKLQSMLLEAMQNISKLKEYDDAVTTSYYMFLMIKYFTDIDLAQTEDFAEQINILNAMIDLEIFEKVLNSFPESEFERTNQFIRRFADRLTELTKDTKNLEEIKNIIGDEVKKEMGEE
jgi:hypothetical protein